MSTEALRFIFRSPIPVVIWALPVLYGVPREERAADALCTSITPRLPFGRFWSSPSNLVYRLSDLGRSQYSVGE